MAADPLTRAAPEADDAADPLAASHDRFVSDAAGVIYLDGNSLGRLPVATRERLGAHPPALVTDRVNFPTDDLVARREHEEFDPSPGRVT